MMEASRPGMSTTPSSVAATHEPFGTRLRHAVTAALFAAVHFLPKLLQVRRNASTWFALRLALGLFGAALVILPLSFGNYLILPIVGLALFLAATLLPPAPQGVTDEEIARELGALIVVDGGDYEAGSVLGFPAKIYVGPEEVRVLDPYHRTLLAIPVAEISSANAEECEGEWSFRIRWANEEALFAYDGIFAEHLARVAQGAVRGVKRHAPAAVPKSRAASA
jgi:hypothetical protein